jgi:hypothetical protein
MTPAQRRNMSEKSPYKEVGIDADISNQKRSKRISLDVPTEKDNIRLRKKKHDFNKKIDWQSKSG